MKFIKILGVFGVATIALAFVSTASATTAESGGVATNSAITIKASILSGNSWLLTDTNNISANECSSSSLELTTSTVTGTSVSGAVSTWTWSNCTNGNPTVDAKGTLSFTNISGTTNATVRSNGVKVTVPSVFGTLTCETSNTDIGTLNGVKSGTASMVLNAVIACTVIGTGKWSGTYAITSPGGLGFGA